MKKIIPLFLLVVFMALLSVSCEDKKKVDTKAIENIESQELELEKETQDLEKESKKLENSVNELNNL